MAPGQRGRPRALPPALSVSGGQQREPVIEALQQTVTPSASTRPRRARWPAASRPAAPPPATSARCGRPARNPHRRSGGVNSATASARAAPARSSRSGRASGASRYRASPATASGSRLVARIFASSHGQHARAQPGGGADRCSQLSSTSSSSRRASTRATVSATGSPGCSRPPVPPPPPRPPAPGRPRSPALPATPRPRTAGHPPGRLGGQPGLTRPARPGHRHQPTPIQERASRRSGPVHRGPDRRPAAIRLPGRQGRRTGHRRPPPTQDARP